MKTQINREFHFRLVYPPKLHVYVYHETSIHFWQYRQRVLEGTCIQKLFIGDPTVFGNLPRCHEAAEAIKSAVESYKNNGYANAVGTKEAREAIAIKFTTKNAPLKVFIQ